MRKLTKTIFAVVLAAAIICTVTITYLVHNITIVSNQYDKLINKYMKNQEKMLQVDQNVYHMQSIVWEHIMSNEQSSFSVYEKQFDKLSQNTKKLLNNLEKNIDNNSDKQNLHLVIKSYNAFLKHAEVVFELSCSGDSKTAQYYVNTNMTSYLMSINGTLHTMDKHFKQMEKDATDKMQNKIARINYTKYFCIILVGFMLLSCIVIVFFNGRRIVSQQSNEIKSHQQHIMDLQYKTIVGMANLIESRDGETGEHVKRTGFYVDLIARELAEHSKYSDVIDAEYIENLWKAAPLHDIGKIKVPDAILQKPGKLTNEEFEVIKTHAREGGNIIDETMGEIEEAAYLQMAHNVAQYHHEKWNGKGYPEGLKGEDIPLCARIMAVADVFDALTSERCYKKAMSVDQAYEIIEESSGSHFDPVVVEAFVKLRPKIEQYLKTEESD